MLAFVALTSVLVIGVLYFFAKVNQKDVLANWESYNKNPFFVFFLAPFYKPDGDNRSRLQFAFDNFFSVMMGFADETMKTLMKPVMQIFKLLTDAIDQTVNGLFNVRGVLKVMWSRFNSMTAVFMTRFQGSLTALRATFMKLHAAIGKTFAIAVAGIMSGLSALQAMFSVFDLIVNIILTILVILAAIFIWLPFILIPVIVIIIMTVNVINDSGQGHKVTGMAEVFCFESGTLVETANGPQTIERVELETRLADGGTVKGVFRFEQDTDDMYALHGVNVSGSHIVYLDNQPLFVKNHPDAYKLPQSHRRVYCLLTSTRRIPIHSSIGTLQFADWEEIDNTVDTLSKWNRQVFEMLNTSNKYTLPTITTLQSESGFTGDTQIMTPLGPVKLAGIYPGYIVFDADGRPTEVAGVVRLASSEIEGYTQLGGTARMSAGTWIKQNGLWTQPQNTVANTGKMDWFQLFTEAGTFQVFTNTNIIKVRDFTDVGHSDIHKTYDWVLETLTQDRKSNL